jgi:hypothetical protein
MTENEFDRTARTWLEDGPTQLSDRVLQAALDEIHVTRQRRAWWPARRFSSMPTTIRLAAVIAAVALAVFGLGLLTTGGGPAPNPTPSAMPSPKGTIVEGDPVALAPGTYVTADPFLVKAYLTVPAYWDGHLGGAYHLDVTRLYGPGEVAIEIFDKLYADACHFEQGIMNPLPGPTVDDLATAMITMPGLESTTPTAVTLGGYAGKQFTITAPDTVDGCTLDQDAFSIWQLPEGAVYGMQPAQIDRVWILDVEGQRIVIRAPGLPGQTPQDKAEVQGILDSIRLAPLPPTASPTP